MPATLAVSFKEMLDSHEDLYPIYKYASHEPFIRSNLGYRGVVMKSKIDGSIMCNDCGKQHKALDAHVRKIHHYESLSQYKEKHGLAQNIPLVTENLSSIHSKSAFKNNLPRFASNITNVKKHKPRFTNHPTSRRNAHGTCSLEQIKFRVEALATIVQRTPASLDARKYDSGLRSVMDDNFGSWNKGMEKLGYKTYQFQARPIQFTREHLVGILRKTTYELKRMPTHKDFKHKDSKLQIPCYNTFISNFGSWRRAKMMAGLDQLLAEVRND